MAALYPEKELSREDIAELERILEKGKMRCWSN